MMQSIKLKGKIGMFTPASFSHQYLLRTTQQSNDKGTWFGWDVSRKGPVTDRNVYETVKGFSDNVAKGEIKAKHGDQESKSDSPY